MDRETYIAPIIESHFPNANHAEKLELTNELWLLFDALYSVYLENARFDSVDAGMVESDSRETLMSAPTP
jgi:hypothetical protein